MLNQSSTRMVLCALTAMTLLTTIGGALAADDGKYPTNWKGEWARVIHPRGGGAVVAFDPTKPWGLGAGGAADAGVSGGPGGQHRRPGQGRARQFSDRPLPAGRHAAHDDGVRGEEFVVTPDTTYILIGRSTTSAASSPTDATGRKRSSRPSRATRSADGSTRTATAATTCSRSRPAASRARAPMTPPACRCTSTTSRSSRSASHLDKTDPNLLHDEIT